MMKAESFLEKDDFYMTIKKPNILMPDKSKVLPKAPLHSFPKAARFEQPKDKTEDSLQ